MERHSSEIAAVERNAMRANPAVQPWKDVADTFEVYRDLVVDAKTHG
jgi:hypothetical protein